MRKCRPPSNENSSHERMLMIVSVDASRMVCLPFLKTLLRIKIGFLHNCPASFRNDPQRRYTLVVREMISLRHCLTAINFNCVGKILGPLNQLSLKNRQVLRLFGAQAAQRPSVNMFHEVQVDEILKLDKPVTGSRSHPVI